METAQTPEIEALLCHYRKNRDSAISQRAHVVLLYLQGRVIRDISQITFHKESTISRWITAYKRDGVGSIFPGYYQNQNAAKLTSSQKKELKQILKAKPIPDKYWTVQNLRKYISTRFDIEYKSPQSYYGLLKLSNFSFKLPAKFDIRRDEQLIKERMAEIREQIQPYLEDPNIVVFCSDESRVEWQTLLRRAWLRKGEKTVIKEKRSKQAQSFIGFLNLQSGEELLYRLDWQDQEHIIPVLISLTEKYPDKRIVIIWDNARFHKGKQIRSQLGQGNPLERVQLINLPPYAPDHNPQERVWNNGKTQVANLVFDDFEELVLAFEFAVMGRNYLYKF